MSITLLHTADWQIGKQFANVPGDPGAALRLQRLDTVKAIAGLAKERAVDAVLVAGDVFEDNAVSDETLRRTLNAMAPFAGPWVLLEIRWHRLRNITPDQFNAPAQPLSVDGFAQGAVPAGWVDPAGDAIRR